MKKPELNTRFVWSQRPYTSTVVSIIPACSLSAIPKAFSAQITFTERGSILFSFRNLIF